MPNQLDRIAKETERSKSFVIQKALEAYMEEYADLQIAWDRLHDISDPLESAAELRNSLGPYYPLQKVRGAGSEGTVEDDCLETPGPNLAEIGRSPGKLSGTEGAFPWVAKNSGRGLPGHLRGIRPGCACSADLPSQRCLWGGRFRSDRYAALIRIERWGGAMIHFEAGLLFWIR
jgi:RHH-type rel operon transcriptional repressor/antitoxin RelB